MMRAVGVVWRARHSSVGFDDLAFDGALLVGEVARYSDVDYEHGNQVRGFWFAGFAGRVMLPGRFDSVAAAQAAVEGALAAGA